VDHRIFATDIEAPEGPIALPDGSMYVTEMSAATSRVTRLDPAGRPTVIKATGGRPNGLALDGDGMIWVAEALLRAVICLDPGGREVVRVDGDADGRFLFPNDLAFGPDGLLYLTDTGMLAADFISGQDFKPGFMDFPWDGKIYAIDPRAGRVVRRFDGGIRFTNGIAFDADHKLYANASLPGDIYRYDVFGPGEPDRQPFGNVLQPHDRTGFTGPDGMAFGEDGRLYCTVYGQSNVTVLDREGHVAERLPLQGSDPTNVAFSLQKPELLVTEVSVGWVERLPAPCLGLALHYPKLGR